MFDEGILQLLLICGVIVYIAIIFYALKKGRLAVKYAIIWLLSGLALLIFSLAPYVVLVLGDIFRIIDPVNFVFLLIFVFLILNTLALSIIVSGFSTKLTKLNQTSALLEKRIRELEGEDVK